MRVRTGEVVRFHSPEVGKKKYHLCLSIDNHFIFLNSPKPRTFLGDFEIDGSKIVGVPPTPEGKSIASCSVVMQFTDAELNQMGAVVVGSVANEVLRDLLIFVENLPTIAPEVRDLIVDNLGDHVGL